MSDSRVEEQPARTVGLSMFPNSYQRRLRTSVEPVAPYKPMSLCANNIRCPLGGQCARGRPRAPESKAPLVAPPVPNRPSPHLCGWYLEEFVRQVEEWVPRACDNNTRSEP